MWKDFDRTAYTPAQFKDHVAGLKWTDWKPAGITLHNTSAPTLAQWAESGPKHDARIANLQSYYEGELGWHAGPHLFISRDFINGFSNILEPGVHSRCYNKTHIGIEMVGEYNVEAFDSGDGAKVRDNAVFAMAVLYRAIGKSPDDLVFHKECKKDNHDCPGKNVVKADMIARVKAKMAELAGGEAASGTVKASPPPPTPIPDAVPGNVMHTDIEATTFNDRMGAYGPIDLTQHGCSLPCAVRAKRLVRITNKANGKSVIAPVVDKGPWNWTDSAYVLGDARPLAETQHKDRTRADDKQIPSNNAGIDLLPLTARQLGSDGKIFVDWEFID